MRCWTDDVNVLCQTGQLERGERFYPKKAKKKEKNVICYLGCPECRGFTRPIHREDDKTHQCDECDHRFHYRKGILAKTS